jgi:GNAT superfamily N-acetyltransferase
MAIMIYRTLEISDALMSNLIGDIGELLTQLTGKPAAISTDYFRQVANRNIWVAALTVGEGKVVGMATLVPVYSPTGFGGRVEDLIVHKDWFGHGINYGLMERVIGMARDRKMSWLFAAVDPNENRVIELFRKLHFVPHRAGNLRLDLSP